MRPGSWGWGLGPKWSSVKDKLGFLCNHIARPLVAVSPRMGCFCFSFVQVLVSFNINLQNVTNITRIHTNREHTK